MAIKILKVKEHERIPHIDGFEPGRVADNHIVGREEFMPGKFNDIAFYELNESDLPENDIDDDGNRVSHFCSSYVIGAQRIPVKAVNPRDSDDEIILVVTTKKDCEDVDFLRMFDVCFNSGLDPEGFSQIYGIDFDQEPIETEAFTSVLSPLIASLFIYTVKKLVAKGLKKEYVACEENKRKIRGRIDIARNERTNIILHRFDRVFCRHHEYTIDNKENRLIKKALTFCQRIFSNSAFSSTSSSILNVCRRLLAEFTNVGDEISLSEIRSIRQHKLFKEYSSAIHLARMILHQYDYSIHNINSPEQRRKVPPFWINMALLYEHYVYGLLREAYGEDVIYQFHGNLGETPDILLRGHTKFILDAKYMPSITDFYHLKLEIIRQLSSYARDTKILKALGYRLPPRNTGQPSLPGLNLDTNSLPIVPCAVIYPFKMSKTKGFINPFLNNPIEKLCSRMLHFVDIYKIGIPLPAIPNKPCIAPVPASSSIDSKLKTKNLKLKTQN